MTRPKTDQQRAKEYRDIVDSQTIPLEGQVIPAYLAGLRAGRKLARDEIKEKLEALLNERFEALGRVFSRQQMDGIRFAARECGIVLKEKTNG